VITRNNARQLQQPAEMAEHGTRLHAGVIRARQLIATEVVEACADVDG
jgi:hypothetical protein